MSAPKKSPFRTFTSFAEASKLAPAKSTDSGGKVYRSVTLIKAGLGNKRDKNYYPASALKKAADAGMFEGIKAYADHQTSVDEEIQPERTVRDFVGLYSDTRFVEDGKGGGAIVGDLRVLRSQKWLSETIDELIEMGAADKIGLSINGRGHTQPEKVTLAESGEEIEANVLQHFIDVRSTDVVTEAGAGGGFQQILESARGAAKETGMNAKQIVSALREAATAGDLKKTQKLVKQLEECGCDAIAEGFKKKKKVPVVEDEAADEDAVAEAEDDVDGTEDEDVDHDADLDDAVEEAKGDDEDLDGDETADEDDTEGADDDDVAESEDEDVKRGSHMKKAVDRLHQHKEAGKKLAKGIATGGGSMTKNAGKQTQIKGRKFGESDSEIARLRNRLQKTEVRNERLAEALRVRQKADVARKLLKESGIPAELRADLVDRLVRLPDELAMTKELRFQQRLLESAATRAREEFEDSFTEVEGAGSRVRESWGGGDDELVDLMRESGLPIKAKK